MLSKFALIAGAVAVLALSACAQQQQPTASVPPKGFGPGYGGGGGMVGGIGGMSYPAPAPQGNLRTTTSP